MPTKERRLSFVVDPTTMDLIDEYRFSNKFQTLSDALRNLIEEGLSCIRTEDAASGDAMRLARTYDMLDAYGRKALDQTAERERERMEAQRGQIRRPLAARGASEPLDLSAIQPILEEEVIKSDLDI